MLLKKLQPFLKLFQKNLRYYSHVKGETTEMIDMHISQFLHNSIKKYSDKTAIILP